jgi:hypothetical protein
MAMINFTAPAGAGTWPGCQSDALPIELKGYPTSPMPVGRRISIYSTTLSSLKFLNYVRPRTYMLPFSFTPWEGWTQLTWTTHISAFSLPHGKDGPEVPELLFSVFAREDTSATPHTGSSARSVIVVW